MRQLAQFVVRQVNQHQRIAVASIIVAFVAVVATRFRDDSQCPG